MVEERRERKSEKRKGGEGRRGEKGGEGRREERGEEETLVL